MIMLKKVLACVFNSMAAPCMRGSGKMGSKRAKEYRNMSVESIIKGNFIMGAKVAMEYVKISMAMSIRESGGKVKDGGQVHSLIIKGKVISASGKTIWNKDMAY